MAEIRQICRLTQKPFVITDEDQAFYAKMGVPLPTLCPDERKRRRLAHRNERALYHRKCDLTGKSIISNYAAEKPYKVYDQKEWWSDKWNGLDYGRDFDFTRTFFEQFAELQKAVPRMNLMALSNENSDYTNHVTYLKDCYLLFSSDYSRDCYYGTWVQESKNCIDNSYLDKCELAYECWNSDRIYNGIYIFNSDQCSDSAFLYDCRNCQNCFMSYGLRNKQYYFMNQALTKEEYEARMQSIDLGSYSRFQAQVQAFKQMLEQIPKLYINRTGQLNDCSGDVMTDCENCNDCYALMRGKDCRYIQGAFDLKDSMDGCYVNGELTYELCECVPSPYNAAFCINTYGGSNLQYCDFCMNDCQDCFGCVGLKRQKYCIFNKQYSKEEYEILRAKIIEHMKKTGEYGEFFPISLSPFGYNETNADEFAPLTKEQALQSGYAWRDEDPQTIYSGPQVQIPDHIKDVADELTSQILTCQETGKLYKIIPQELDFYRKMGVPVPRNSVDQRHKNRFHLQKPHVLYQRSCSQCGVGLKSVYSPSDPDVILCESCYLKTVY